MYLVTYPDYLEKETNIILHNINDEYKHILLPMLFDHLPEESVIVISENQIEWAKEFKNSYWFLQDNVVDSVTSSRQYNITSVEQLVEYCRDLFKKINI